MLHLTNKLQVRAYMYNPKPNNPTIEQKTTLLSTDEPLQMSYKQFIMLVEYMYRHWVDKKRCFYQIGKMGGHYELFVVKRVCS